MVVVVVVVVMVFFVVYVLFVVVGCFLLSVNFNVMLVLCCLLFVFVLSSLSLF